MKLGIVGSRKYTNRDRMSKIMDLCIKRHKNLEIVSGGAQGADFLAKSLALEKNLKYVEFAPCHCNYNKYCYQPPEYFGKSYNAGNFFKRNIELVEYIDEVLAFIVKGIEYKGTKHTLSMCNKLNKKYILITDEY